MSFIEINQHFSPDSEFLYIFLFTITIIWLLLVLFSLKKFGIKKTTRCFLPMMIAALFIEASGVANGRFYYPNNLIYFSIVGGSVPLIILLGWSSNLFLFLNMGKSFAIKLYQKQNLIQMFIISIISAVFGICLDLLEDPLANNNGWWIWTESNIKTNFFGVPLSNFVDWFIIIFFMSFATLLIDRLKYSENRKLMISLCSIPVIFMLIFAAHLLFENIFRLVGLY